MKNLLILFTLISFNLKAQETISFSVAQDLRLLVSEDDSGNTAGKTDLIFNMNLEGKQLNWYYFSIQTQFEYADLSGGEFYRYSVHGMWAFNQLFIPKLEATIGVGVGMIHRSRELKLPGLWSYSITGELTYPISKKLSVLARYEIVRRFDLVELHKEQQMLKPNFSIGIS